MLNSRRTLFPETSIQVIAATVKPEYAQYIKRFGFPPGGVFEMDKLAMAMRDLNMTVSQM
jgi:hypothetical protein